MREIKFRVLDANGQMVFSGKHYDDELGMFFEQMSPDGEDVMQYTGLKDKNGVEIYEGDLIKLDPKRHPFYPNDEIIGQVFWNEYESEWAHTYYDDRPPKKMFKGCEVIGNIYEGVLSEYANPDIIEQYGIQNDRSPQKGNKRGEQRAQGEHGNSSKDRAGQQKEGRA